MKTHNLQVTTMTTITINKEELISLLRNRRVYWTAAFVGGAVVALAGGTILGREARRRHKLPPVKGAYESIKAEGINIAEGTTIRLTFSDEWVDIYAGGNDMTGTIIMNGATMYWSEEDSTNIGCMPNIAIQDAWLTEWLNSGVTLYRDSKRLVLSKNDVKIVFKRIEDN
jgi:heat shock protein HslJ